MNNGIDIYVKDNFNENSQIVNFSDWLKYKHSDEELREIFISMDLAMKYIHNKGYCIKSFNPDSIKILNNSLDQIKYDTVLKMPNDYFAQKELTKEDIYSSAFLQIGIYTKCLKYLKPKFLSENFDNFSTFLPESDVPYYRGIVQKGLSVYLSDYAIEKKKRDLQSLSEGVDLDAGNSMSGKSLIKSNGHFINDNNLLKSNQSINSSIYGQLDNRRDAAFINFATCLVISGLIGLVLLFIVCFLNT